MSTTPDPDDVHYHLQASINRLKQALGHLEVPLAALTADWDRLVSEEGKQLSMARLESKLDLVRGALRDMVVARVALEDLSTRV